MSFVLPVLLVLVCMLPFVMVGICFMAKRYGDEVAGYYLLMTLTVWMGALGAASITARAL